MPKARKQGSDVEVMDREIRAVCKILSAIARRFPRWSAEREAIRNASAAFVYLRLHEDLKRSYAAYRRGCTKPLTRAQELTLKRMGVPL